MARIELHATLDRSLIAEVTALVDTVTALDGHPPISDHKHAHLVAGADDWTGVFAREDDHLVGYAHLRWNAPASSPRAATEVVTHPDAPDRDEVARRLLDEVRAIVARAGGGVLHLWVHRVLDPERTLAARLGFSVDRDLAYMSSPLATRPEVPEPPEDVTLRRFRDGADDAELLRVNNAAFADHPEQGGWDQTTLDSRRRLDWYDPEGIVTAWRGERMLGFHWTKEHHHPDPPPHESLGEVYVLGVDPAAQGLGLGRLLLLAGLAHLHDRGCRQAILYVDRADAGAVALYESAGFAVAHSEVCYADRIDPAPADDLTRPA